MPAKTPHSIKSETLVDMLLTLLKGSPTMRYLLLT
jgi:hypothetical protein